MSLTQAELERGELTVVGQLVDASNGSLLCTLEGLTDEGEGRSNGPGPFVIYKPRAGERPLWDFPTGTLSLREVAAFVVSDSLGWPIVPPTVWRDGPFGPGMVQEWVDVDTDTDLVALVQSDREDLRRIAVFDAVINNGDRKGGHLLPTRSGQVWGIDHGVTFAVEDKLRTVLWQWRGRPIPRALLDDLERWHRSWDHPGGPADRLSHYLADEEVTLVDRRVQSLLRTQLHPQPSPDWPAIPWPPF